MTTFGYSMLFLTEAFCSTLISNTSNSHYHQDFRQWQLPHMLPGVGGNFCYELLSTSWSAQAWLRCTSMVTLALQHQHHHPGSSPKSGATFDNRATSFCSTRKLSSWIRRPKLPHWKQTYDCSSQREMYPYYGWPSKTACCTKRHSSTHCHPLQFSL